MANSNNSTTKRGYRFIDLTGCKFGRLSVIAFKGIAKDRQAQWLCRCECEAETIVAGGHLRSGHTKSCTCLSEELSMARFLVHGQRRKSATTSEYIAYTSARTRCNNPNSQDYPEYGGRGIEFRFESFEEFFSELGHKPTPKHSVDRIKVNGHYERGNIRWATAKEQAQNRRPRRRRH